MSVHLWTLRLLLKLYMYAFASSQVTVKLAVGHAPKKCANCGRWFLTRNARPAKYCGGYDPDSGKKWGCRQVSNCKGGEHRELAPDHPLKQIYRKRLNTINQGIRRGSPDQELGDMMKTLAKNKLRRAIRDIPYAQNHYEKEMEQEDLKAEAMAKLGRSSPSWSRKI